MPKLSRADEQKRLERAYLDEARRASRIFPDGDMIPFDPFPDFVLSDNSLGIEVTELCDPDGRSDGSRLGLVVPRAKALYMQRPGVRRVDVSPMMSTEAEEMRVDELVKGLADFVYAHRDTPGSFDDDDELPQGWCYIAIGPPLESDGDGNWIAFRDIYPTPGTRAMLLDRIAKKDARLLDYRGKVSGKVWLLIVNNRHLGPGEVYMSADVFANAEFNFKFDKVLVFLRDMNGSGDVVELRRRAGQE